MIAMMLVVLAAFAGGGLTVYFWRNNINPFRSKTVAQVKVLTPLDNPWGTTAELVAWAERRAVDEHRAAYRDPVTEELEKRFLAEFRKGGVTVLEDYNFRTPNEVRERLGFENIQTAHIRMTSGQYGRHLDGIGYVTASSPELLNRACEVVLARKRDPAFDLLMDMFEKVPGGVRQDSTWIMGRVWYDRLRKMIDTNGNPLWHPSVDVAGPNLLLGLPIVILDDDSTPRLELSHEGAIREQTQKILQTQKIPAVDVGQ